MPIKWPFIQFVLIKETVSLKLRWTISICFLCSSNLCCWLHVGVCDVRIYQPVYVCLSVSPSPSPPFFNCIVRFDSIFDYFILFYFMNGTTHFHQYKFQNWHRLWAQNQSAKWNCLLQCSKLKFCPQGFLAYFKFNDLIYYLVWPKNMFVYNILYIHTHAHNSFFIFCFSSSSSSQMKLSETLLKLTPPTPHHIDAKRS